MKGNFKHGGIGTKLYNIWKGMRSRCNNPNHHKYYRYGGRGIKVCAEWEDYANFRDWSIRNGFKENLSIDRIDNNGDYEPSNCRWVSQKEQANNRGYRSDTTFVTKDGETHSLMEWSSILGINYKTLIERKRRGCVNEEILLGR